jgi:cytolethal distending toxin subunit B
MRGCDARNDNRWTSTVAAFFQNSQTEIVLLQECGAPPVTAMLNPVEDMAWLPPVPRRPVEVQYGLWYTGSTAGTASERHLYHATWDVGGDRCNLAIVTRSAPISLVYIPNPLRRGLRPAIGVCYGTAGGPKLIFSIHGLSGSGNDCPRFLHAMSALAGYYGMSWVCGGDFNRQPQEWNRIDLPGDANSNFAREMTFPASRSIFDYAWSSREPDFPPVVHSTIYPSDHYPVSFGD